MKIKILVSIVIALLITITGVTSAYAPSTLILPSLSTPSVGGVQSLPHPPLP